MSKVLRKQRLSKPHNRTNKMYKKGATKFPKPTEEMREGIVSEIVHERGRNAPLAMITMVNEDKTIKKEKVVLVALEGMYTGKTIYFGEKTPLSLGNTMCLKNMPDGTVICSVERVVRDGGSIAKTSGSYATVVGYNPDKNESRIKLPSGIKKTLSGDCRAMIGIIASGGVHEKPLLKAGRAYYKQKARGKLGAWPRVRGVAMNPVDHVHGGGNHQHIGKSSCVGRNAPPGQKVGQIAAKRTGTGRAKTKRFE
ncbi:large subunit ribosomal protein L8e [Nematocida parisii]|uniref:Ribosomal protein L2 n=1 Tax=Nematocida parisii (strain ERTm3) TaxID=935791 RepID=I3EG86_NEMP3|nr:ribosomal protein L2 [Nematocida parisii ERTm1]EIJ88233.1 ribosomal protein L2 [Nematocida parisii ERTm3]KAI5125364.1 large subunit ribosomal protein L8e [Nematocida parisii]KAI5165309.1 large subunit ribosomal protein L8e [Nematocida sp. AWRm79]KAI5182603.1 large subunit ribosomal protein L8e [Nematocida sp. AWRm78]OAG30361.1 large subunit ribosomal protein L8e [Nematocida sp. ERTm5]|eukprot:XP_013059101.1 ribosomal protein L2 [Nematocida parisii ERTm1]